MKRKKQSRFQDHRRRRPQQTTIQYTPELLRELHLTNVLSQDPDGVVIYVDGSHSRSIRKRYAYSFVVVENNEIRHMEAGVGGNHLGLNNIAGELLAAKKAVAYAIRNEKKKVTLFYDFCGIKDIAESNKAMLRNEMSQEYRDFIRYCRTKIDIQFVYVKSHAGNYFNETADLLARQALGIPTKNIEQMVL